MYDRKHGSEPACIWVYLEKTHTECVWGNSMSNASLAATYRTDGREVRQPTAELSRNALLFRKHNPRPNFHTLGLILSGCPQNTAAVDWPDKNVVLNFRFLLTINPNKHLNLSGFHMVSLSQPGHQPCSSVSRRSAATSISTSSRMSARAAAMSSGSSRRLAAAMKSRKARCSTA